MTTSFTVYHPGLTFATLVLQFVMANGGVIQRLEARRRGSGENPDEDPDSSATNSSGPTPTPSSSSKSDSTSAKANASSSSSASPTSSLPSTMNSSTSSPSSTGASPTISPSGSPTALPAIDAVRSNMPTPVIVGSVIGSLVVGGLVVLLLIMCCRRIRRASKDPDRRLPAIFLPRGPKAQSSRAGPEMSQTQTSPLVASAIAAGLTSNPSITRYSRSFHSSSSSPASTSPLVPASNLPGHSNSVTSSSGRSTSHTTATSELGILQPPRGSPITSPSSLLPIIAAAAEAAAESPPPTSVELSPLHRSLTMHQKALEVDEKGREGRMEIEELQGINDPPPEYDA